MKVYVRSACHLHKIKISMLVNLLKFFAMNPYLCYYALAAGLCKVYVSTSLLGPTEREALILALKYNLDELQNPHRPWFWSFGQVGGCHEDGMKQTCSPARFRKMCGNKQTNKQTSKQASKQTNKHRPGNFAAESVSAPVRFSFQWVLWNLT